MERNNKYALKYVDRDEFLTPLASVLDDIFANQFPQLTKELGGVGFFDKQSYPRVDVIDHNDYVEIVAEIPGLNKDEVSVEVQDDKLTISGQKSTKNTTNQASSGVYIRRELKHSSFKRSFTLSEVIRKDDPTAKFENGLLTIRLKKLKPTIPTVKRVAIE